MKVKIGFILAVNDSDVQWYKPLSFGYLKSYLEKHTGGDAEMVYLTSPEEAQECDIVGISATSQCYDIATGIARSVKSARSSTVTVVGGHHISSLPQTLAQEFDLGVVGEGEETFLEVVRAFMEGRLRDPGMLGEIDGIVFHDGGKVVESRRRQPLQPLDAIPFPYRNAGDEVYFITSRGCPFKCSFCSSTAFWGKTRFFSAEYVIGEIEAIVRQHPETTQISIWDDLFIANKERFRQFCSLMHEKKLTDRVSISFSLRADLVDVELCNQLKDLGVTVVGFGAESGSDRILSLLNKNSTVEVNQRAIDLLHSFGFKVSCSFIVGSPTETEEEVRSTYEFILRNISEGKVDPAIPVNIMMPIPGTPLWEDAVAKGTVDPAGLDWGRLSLFASYRHSNSGSFAQWVEARRRNRSVYLAEDTLPQERLYQMMGFYEELILHMESHVRLKAENAVLMSQLQEKERFIRRCLAPLYLLKRVAAGFQNRVR